MVTTNKGPVSGIYVPVKLPYGKDKKVVQIKKPIAKYLKLNITELPSFNSNNKGVKTGRKTTKRYLKGGYRGKSIKLIFSKEQTINKKKVKQISVPLPKGVHVSDAYGYFNAKAKDLKLTKLITPDGRGLPFTKVD